MAEYVAAFAFLAKIITFAAQTFFYGKNKRFINRKLYPF